MSWYMEPFHLKSSAVKPPAVELPTAFWYEMVILIHTIFLDKFRLVFLSISSSLSKGSRRNITSQNRWWDYPTAWWNHQTPWKIIESRVCHALPLKNSWNYKFFFQRSLSYRSSVISATRCADPQDAQHTESVCRSEIFPISWPGRYPK